MRKNLNKMSEESTIVQLNSLRSQIAELRYFDENSAFDSDKENFLREVGNEVESILKQIFVECSSNLSSLSNEDLNTFLDHLAKELNKVEAENASVECEIEDLSTRCIDDYNKLENELERLSCLSNFLDSQNPEKTNEDMQTDFSNPADDQDDSKFKMLEMSHQIEKSKTTLKSMQDLDSIFQRFEAVEKIEDALTGLRVIEIEENSIRLSLNTYIPNLESVLRQQDIDDLIEPLELNHELIIETINGTLELKNVEIFPNDVYIGEVIDAAKSFRQLYPMSSVMETRSSLEWFVRKVQDRIAFSSIKRFVIKNANKSRHSLEYLDREDVIVAHMVGGVDAFMKLPQGWPLSEFGLELKSLKSTSQSSKEISLSVVCKIVEMANSLNAHLRQNISRFTDSVEEILMQQMRAELITK